MTRSAGIVLLLLAAVGTGCGTTAPYRGGAPHSGAREALSGRRFVWPVAGPVSSGFGSRGGGKHDGIDILAPAGTDVHAAAAGVVAYATDGMRGYGNAVVLDHGDGVTTLYGHLATIRVESADVVAVGAVIGTVGRTGNATAYHLHFELRVDGEAVDPREYLTP